MGYILIKNLKSPYSIRKCAIVRFLKIAGALTQFDLNSDVSLLVQAINQAVFFIFVLDASFILIRKQTLQVAHLRADGK